MKEILGATAIVFGIFALVAVVCSPIFLLGLIGDRATCASVSRQTGRPTNYSFMSGCYVKTEYQWVPLSSWRVVE